MKKALLLSLFLLMSCSPSIQKDGANIKTLYFAHVPTEAIKVGEFDKAGILLHVDYSDRTSSEFPVTESWLPEEYLHFLGEEGSYYVKIYFRGKEVGLRFSTVSNANAPQYQVTFLDYRGNRMESYSISYRRDAVFHGEAPYREGYVFAGWDQSLHGVCKDMIYLPVYEVAA